MISNIRIEYDPVYEMAKCFTVLRDNNDTSLQRIHQYLDVLMSGGWAGEGADAFYNEMADIILPAMQQLIYALEQTDYALKQVALALREAEEDSAALFTGASGVDLLKNLMESLSNLAAFAGGVDEVLYFLSKHSDTFKSLLKNVKGLKFLAYAGYVLDPLLEVITGEEDILNASGKSLQSLGIDLLLAAASSGVIPLAVGVSDLISLSGQGFVWLQRESLNLGEIDPGVRAALEEGLDNADQVFKGSRINDTVDSLKDMIWDVTGRPIVNDINAGLDHFNKALSTGSVREFTEGLSHFGQAAISTTFPVLHVLNTAGDENVRGNLKEHISDTINNGKDLVLSLPQLPDEIVRIPLRMTFQGFSQTVNSLPLSDGFKRDINNVTVDAIEFVNTTPLGGVIIGGPFLGLASKVAQSLQD